MKTIIILFLTLLSVSCLCQESDDKKFNDVHFYNFNITNPKEKTNTPLTLSGVEVHDCRYDTSGIGFLQTSDFHLTVLKSGKSLTETIKKYYSSFIENLNSSNAQPELHCYIKKLTLSDFINTSLTAEEHKSSSEKFDIAERSGIMIKLEFYAKKETVFYPLCRFDTTLTGLHNIIDRGRVYLEEALSTSIKKITSLNYENIFAKGKKLTEDTINSFNQTRFALPVLNKQPAKGIFLTFEDFRNNKVTEKQFSVDKSKKGDFLYIKNEKGEDILLTDLWGYSDGRDIFIFSASNYFKLYKMGNSFKFYGAKDYTSKRVMRMNFRLTDLINPNSNYSKGHTKVKYKLVKSFLHLDIENGEIY
jgi:hypothetical protein